MSKVHLKFVFMLEGRKHERVFPYWDAPIPAVGSTVTLPLYSINGRRYYIPETRDLLVEKVAWSVKLNEPSDLIVHKPGDVQAVYVEVLCEVLE